MIDRSAEDIANPPDKRYFQKKIDEIQGWQKKLYTGQSVITFFRNKITLKIFYHFFMTTYCVAV